jgi:hypothetical protein
MHKLSIYGLTQEAANRPIGKNLKIANGGSYEQED